MRTDDEGHRYEENVRGGGRTEGRLRSILKTVGTGENVGQGYPDCTRTRKHSTSQRDTHAPTSPGTREKGMESAESENGRLQRVNAWVKCEKRECVVLTCRGTTCMVMVIHFDNLL